MYKTLLLCSLVVSSSFVQNNEVQVIENRIYNSETLSDFYSELRELENKQNGIISIAHIGDSHIQADFLTGAIRRKLHERFGNAGRGFVFPYKIAQSWGPLDIKFTHTGEWHYCDIKRNTSICNMGASGFTITSSPSSSFTLDAASKASTNASFTKIIFLDNYGSFLPTTVSGSYSATKLNNHTVIYFDEPQDSLEFRPILTNNNLPELQGIILENEQPGILYHALGINGSTVSQYLRSSGFEGQLAELGINLAIISFGTNDAYKSASDFCTSCVINDYRQLIGRIRSKNPKVAILLTTPPDHFYLQRYDNPNIAKLRDAMLVLAKEENIAVWDLFRVMGGKNTILDWRKQQLARGDLIHFTQEGYKLQGELLYEALMSHLNQ
jgi:lysophospholipase L1-like esterase